MRDVAKGWRVDIDGRRKLWGKVSEGISSGGALKGRKNTALLLKKVKRTEGLQTSKG